MIEFSFLLPTRGRPEQVRRFAQSVIETAADPSQIEVILCVDEDDPDSHHIDCLPLESKTVVVPPGLSMGALNRACFAASTGRYLMLINDDVIVRTKDWDTTILSLFRGYQDDILLVHVNDLLFREKLCTFPILSRQACLEIGLCPAEYHRYRLDDHIFDTYCLLAHLGHKRIVYLSNVVFEHLNHSSGKADDSVQAFHSNDDKAYIPNQEILNSDAAVFDAKVAERKANAVRLAGLIDQHATKIRAQHHAQALRAIADTRSLRRPENIICRPPLADRRRTASVTVAIVTGNLRNAHTRKCLDLVKRHTSDFDLMLLDNNGSKSFNHPREMNKVLRAADTDYVVLMDDDVFVEPGWLPGLLRATDDQTGVVVPLHKDAHGALSFSGIYLMGDEFGTHAHLQDVPPAPRMTQCACSALMLVDRRKCGHVLFCEQYNKYFLDIDYSLRIWEAGCKVVCTPDVAVTHVGGATMPRHSTQSQRHVNIDMLTFMQEWSADRMARLENEVWSRHPGLREQCEIPRRIQRVMEQPAGFGRAEFESEIEACYELSAPYPLFRSRLVTGLRTHLRRSEQRNDSTAARLCRKWLWKLRGTEEIFGGMIPRLISSRRGYNLVECGSQVLAVSPALGMVDVRNPETRELPGVLVADSLDSLRNMVDAAPLAECDEVAAPEECDVLPCDVSAGDSHGAPRLVEGGYRRLRKELKALLEAVGVKFTGPCSLAAIARGRYIHLAPGSRLANSWAPFRRLASRGNRLRKRLQAKIGNSGRRLIDTLHLQTARAGGLGNLVLATGTLAGRSVAPAGPRSSGSPSERNDSCFVPNSEFDVNVAARAELVQQDHAGFDIYYFNTKYFGVRTGIGKFDLRRLRNGESGAYFVGNTILEVTSEIDRVSSRTNKPKALVVCALERPELLNYLPLLNEFDLNLLVTADDQRLYRSHKSYVYADAHGKTPAVFDLSQLSPDLLAKLRAEQFDVVVLPTDRVAWRTLHAERLAIALSARLSMVFGDGQQQTYKGEDLHRIIYNTAYLNSLFRFVPDLSGKTILDVGCSDGLVCHLLLSERPKKIVGIDILETVGCRYPHPQISYFRKDATRTEFPDRSFDVCVSIATFEHVSDPPAVMREMKRVTAHGGYCYIQAGPLYHSPFGHHMFGFFDELPWIHLRRTKAQIVDYARQTGADRKIQETFGKDVVRYVDEMINREHVNQKFLREYGIDEFLKEERCELVFFNQSYEGEPLLDTQVLKELGPYARQDLIAHGFELLFRVV